MKTYLVFRSIGMTEDESLFCATFHSRKKRGEKIHPDDKKEWNRLRDKYREFWAMLIGQI